MTTIGQRELRNDNASIMRRVEAGENFVVTRNGVPVAELRAIAPARQRFVSPAAVEQMVQAWDDVDGHALRRDLDEAMDPWLPA